MKQITFFSLGLTILLNIRCQRKMEQTSNISDFPTLDAKTLAGRKVTFPEVTKGKKSFLVLAFEDKGAYENCQKQATEWAEFWEKNLKEAQVEFYEIPMMSGKYKWVRFWVDGGMRSGIDKGKHDNVACFYGDKSKYMNLLNINDLSQAHVFLIDTEGGILSRASGAPNEETMKIMALSAQ